MRVRMLGARGRVVQKAIGEANGSVYWVDVAGCQRRLACLLLEHVVATSFAIQHFPVSKDA